jgi:hypothetical protein
MRDINFPGRRRRWLSLLSVTAVAATTVTAVLVTTVTPAIGATSLPAFYVTTNSNSQHTATLKVEVHRTSNGAVTGTIPAPSQWTIEGISAAANDRTFFLAEQHGQISSCPTDRFVEFSITSNGVPTGLHQVGSDATGMVGSLTASPDGSRLAYTTVCNTVARPGPTWVLHVMNLPSGKVSTWTSSPKASGTANVTEAGNQALAWTANGRELSFAYQWQPSQANYADMSVVLVNPDSGSGTLQAHSRLIWHQNSHCGPSSCVFNAWISPDGTSLLAEALSASSKPLALEHLSLPAGRVTSVLFRTTVPNTGAGIWEPPAYLDGSDTYWLVCANAETELGWVRQGQFHPLQSLRTVEQAAW